MNPFAYRCYELVPSKLPYSLFSALVESVKVTDFTDNVSFTPVLNE